MKLVKMKDTDLSNCLLYALAMLLEEEPKVLMDEIGHDGHVKVFKMSEPLCYNGFHIQEIIDCCISRGYGLMPIEASPVMKPLDDPLLKTHRPYANPDERFCKHVGGRKGLIIGNSLKGIAHAVAWSGDRIFDPHGMIYPLSDFAIRECWILTKLI